MASFGFLAFFELSFWLQHYCFVFFRSDALYFLDRISKTLTIVCLCVAKMSFPRSFFENFSPLYHFLALDGRDMAIF